MGNKFENKKCGWQKCRVSLFCFVRIYFDNDSTLRKQNIVNLRMVGGKSLIKTFVCVSQVVNVSLIDFKALKGHCDIILSTRNWTCSRFISSPSYQKWAAKRICNLKNDCRFLSDDAIRSFEFTQLTQRRPSVQYNLRSQQELTNYESHSRLSRDHISRGNVWLNYQILLVSWDIASHSTRACGMFIPECRLPRDRFRV